MRGELIIRFTPAKFLVASNCAMTKIAGIAAKQTYIVLLLFTGLIGILDVRNRNPAVSAAIGAQMPDAAKRAPARPNIRSLPPPQTLFCAAPPLL